MVMRALEKHPRHSLICHNSLSHNELQRQRPATLTKGGPAPFLDVGIDQTSRSRIRDGWVPAVVVESAQSDLRIGSIYRADAGVDERRGCYDRRSGRTERTLPAVPLKFLRSLGLT